MSIRIKSTDRHHTLKPVSRLLEFPVPVNRARFHRDTEAITAAFRANASWTDFTCWMDLLDEYYDRGAKIFAIRNPDGTPRLIAGVFFSGEAARIGMLWRVGRPHLLRADLRALIGRIRAAVRSAGYQNIVILADPDEEESHRRLLHICEAIIRTEQKRGHWREPIAA